MMRRFFILAGFWFGLLGVAQPLLACTMNAPAHDCCPAGTQAPCDHNPAPMDGGDGLQACCASAPLGAPAAVSLKNSDDTTAHRAVHGDVPLIAFLPAFLFFVPSVLPPPPNQTTEPPDAGGTQIYLHTARLRL